MCDHSRIQSLPQTKKTAAKKTADEIIDIVREILKILPNNNQPAMMLSELSGSFSRARIVEN